ncbi:unnamed protein product, partial [Effrenium voratum]
QKLGLNVIVVHPHGEVQLPGVALRRPSLADGCEVMRVASEFQCVYALRESDPDEPPWTLQPQHRRWVDQCRHLCELRFCGDDDGVFRARLPAHLKRLTSSVPPQVQRFKELLPWKGTATVLTVNRGVRQEHLLCIGDCPAQL